MPQHGKRNKTKQVGNVQRKALTTLGYPAGGAYAQLDSLIQIDYCNIYIIEAFHLIYAFHLVNDSYTRLIYPFSDA